MNLFYLYKILERPVLSALLAGSVINLLQWLLTWLISGTALIEQKWHGVTQSPLLAAALFAIPYLVPFAVTTFARKLSNHKIQSVLNQFPEANPDVVMRFNNQHQLEYINPVGRQWMESHQLTPDQNEHLLPQSLLDAFRHNKSLNTLEGEKRFGSVILHYKARSDTSGAWMVTARDVSETRKLQDSLDKTLHQLNALNGFLATSLKAYDPKHFDLFSSFSDMLNHIACHSEDAYLLPEYVFCTFTDNRSSDQTTWGQIYSLQQRQAHAISPPFQLETSGYAYAISQGKEEVFFESWQPSSGSLETFQHKFNPRVRELVGQIYGYATYQSGSVAVIGFFKNHNVNQTFQHLLKQMAVIAQSFQRISQESEALYRQFVYSLEALARASEANDEDTGEHILRINEYAYVLARELGEDDAFCNEIRLTAMMHDVGKIHLDPHILNKPGPLTENEKQEMQKHPEYGANILGDSENMKMAREIALYHHEKYDGSGYPHGLKADDIPLAARIVGLVDVYDALRQKRAYKPALSHKQTVKIITHGDGRTRPEEFDPKALAAFMQIHTEFDRIFSDRNH